MQLQGQKRFEMVCDETRALIEVRYLGAIDFDTWLQAHEALHQLGDGCALAMARYIVCDFSAASMAQFSSADITQKSRVLLSKAMTLNPAITIIIIVPRALEFGLMRMLQGSIEGSSPWTSHLVRSMEECRQLLNSLTS